MNWNIFLANVIVAFHLAYVAFVVVLVPVIVVGGLLKWKWVRNFWLRFIHFIMIAVVVVETVFGVTCPLTTWETNLRMAGGQYDFKRDANGEPIEVGNGMAEIEPTKEYQQDFVGRCLREVLFYDQKELPTWVLNTCYFGFGAMILATLFLIPPHWPRRKRADQPAAT